MKLNKSQLKNLIIEELIEESNRLNTSTTIKDIQTLINVLSSNIGQSIKWKISPELQQMLKLSVDKQSGIISFIK